MTLSLKPSYFSSVKTVILPIRTKELLGCMITGYVLNKKFKSWIYVTQKNSKKPFSLWGTITGFICEVWWLWGMMQPQFLVKKK